MIRTHMWTHSRSKIIAVRGTPCAIPPRNGNTSSERDEIPYLTQQVEFEQNYSLYKILNIDCFHLSEMFCEVCKPNLVADKMFYEISGGGEEVWENFKIA
jgi:hypothetical protein